MLESIILGMVLDDDRTGYDIKKMIENGIGVFYKASYGSLYPALKKLSVKGSLTPYDKPDGGRRKIYYHITEKGRGDFLEWLSSPMNLFDGTNTHLAKVYFFDQLEPDIRSRLLKEHEMNNQNYLRKLKGLEKEFRKVENSQCFYYKLSTLYYGICITEKTIEWCRHVRAQSPLVDLMEEE